MRETIKTKISIDISMIDTISAENDNPAIQMHRITVTNPPKTAQQPIKTESVLPDTGPRIFVVGVTFELHTNRT